MGCFRAVISRPFRYEARPMSPPTTLAVISAKDLRLKFGLQQVFSEATMSVHEGEKLGLVGRNGSGKTSLMRIIAGVENPDSGTVSRRNGLIVGYLAQE
jgi:ATP-binding cassette subfamily F protein uup